MNETKTYRINEIFYSLQGEGYHTGTAAVFIRFAGCNLRCDFCDTDFSTHHTLTAEQIVKQVRQYPAPLIILTGGEPTLQIDNNLITLLKTTGKTLCIETNGTNPVADGIDWITCSPKGKSKIKLTKANEVKVVYIGQDVESYINLIEAEHYYLQPCSLFNTDKVVQYIKQQPWWRLSLQTHKYIDIR